MNLSGLKASGGEGVEIGVAPLLRDQELAPLTL